jgi:hypothetical protein
MFKFRHEQKKKKNNPSYAQSIQKKANNKQGGASKLLCYNTSTTVQNNLHWAAHHLKSYHIHDSGVSQAYTSKQMHHMSFHGGELYSYHIGHRTKLFS